MGLRAPQDYREPADNRTPKGELLTVQAPTCPSGFPDYEVRNPLNRDRCRKTITERAALECKLLITDKKENWTGPHARPGEDECRSEKGKDPKGTRCPSGFDHVVQSGADECRKVKHDYVTPVCPAGWDYESVKDRDYCRRK
jgi:hypothetical protein